ncbi:hypothetical protein MSAN_02197000 [Mycena sanguinolenta]|uniref:MYND-type domain-containing protein n=1 Tax=Mycena sanguinolenta TaxID=230812 RepID=A0A8H6XDW9_9AGAR|nr:hypothetical protein MSAN_02197000 [Mycena sanguinolenta]
MDEPRASREPRAHLDGVNIRKDFSLPALSSVRADAVRSREMRKRPEELENVTLMFPAGGSANKESLPKHLRLELIFGAEVPSLFRFSFYAHVDDMPEDIMDDCIWALSTFIRIMEECSETVLRATGNVQENEDCHIVKYYTLLNARWKIVFHLLDRNRPEEAVPFAKAIAEEACSHGDEGWLRNPTPFFLYGETLVLTRRDDDEAVRMLRRALFGLESGNGTANQSHNASPILELIQTRTWLARALRNIHFDNEAETHEKWLIGWFRKNPHLIMDRDLRRLLFLAGPVLEGLGGETWFETRKKTTKTAERSVKACRTCRAREPLVTLLRCTKCKYIYYCSKECQRADWKHHKVLCWETVADLEKIEHLRLTDPDSAKLAEDWALWSKQSRFDPLVHALGLHRDPTRGHTYIVFQVVEYVPTATKLKNKFPVVSCGVFRIKDVLHDIELIMGLNRGEGQEYVESLFSESAGRPARVPYIYLSFGDGISPRLGCGSVTEDSVLSVPYDPEWRKRFNAGAPPRPMVLKSGVKDVEHIF